MGTASVAEAAALLAAGPEASLLVNKRIERAASAHWAWTWAQKGRQSRGPPPWRSPRPPANGRPPRGTSTSLAVAQAASICSLRRPPGPGPQHGLGGLRALSRPCFEPLRRPDQWALRRPTHPGTPTLCPGPGSGQPGPDGVPGLLRRQRHLRHGRAGPGTVAAARGRQQTGLQRAPRPLCPAAGGGPGRGAADARLLHDQPQRSAHALAIDREAPAGCGLGRFCGGSLQPSLARPRLAAGQGPGAAGRGAHHRHSRGAGPPTGPPGGGRSACTGSATSPTTRSTCSAWCWWATAPPGCRTAGS